LAEITRQQLNKRGVTEIQFESYKADEPDYQPLVDKLANANIDVMYAGGYQGDIAVIIRQAKKLRFIR